MEDIKKILRSYENIPNDDANSIEGWLEEAKRPWVEGKDLDDWIEEAGRKWNEVTKGNELMKDDEDDITEEDWETWHEMARRTWEAWDKIIADPLEKDKR